MEILIYYAISLMDVLFNVSWDLWQIFHKDLRAWAWIDYIEN